MLLTLERYAKCEEVSKLALRMVGSMVPARINLAWSLYYQGNKKEAFQNLENALWSSQKTGRHPVVDVFFHIGQYHFEEREYLLAESFFRKAIHACDSTFNPYAYYLALGRTLLAMNDKRALRILQSAGILISEKPVQEAVLIELNQLVDKASQSAKPLS